MHITHLAECQAARSLFQVPRRFLIERTYTQSAYLSAYLPDLPDHYLPGSGPRDSTRSCVCP